MRERDITVDGRTAAAMLGVSHSHFKRHVRPHLRPIYCGQRVLFLVSDLTRWAESEADR